MKLVRGLVTSAVGLILVCMSVCIGATCAQAKMVHAIDDAGKAPETTAYIKNISYSQISNIKLAPGIKIHQTLPGTNSNWWFRGNVVYKTIEQNQTYSQKDAISFDVSRIGYTVDGRYLDASVSFDVSLSGYQRAQGGLNHAFLVIGTPWSEYSWGYTSAALNTTNDGTADIGASTTVHTYMQLFYHDSHEPYVGRIAFQIGDLDSSEGAIHEHVKLGGGFSDNVYISSQTLINKDRVYESGGTEFYPLSRFTEPKFESGFLAYVEESAFDFEWGGTYCQTWFGSPSNGYPISQVGTPVKKVHAVGDTILDAQSASVERGQEVTFSIQQHFPYVVGANAPRAVTVVDDFDSRLDISDATLRVTKEPDAQSAASKDVSDDWELLKKGMSLSIAPKNLENTGGTYTFYLQGVRVSGTARLGQLTNVAKVHVESKSGTQSVEKTSADEVVLNVEPAFRRVVIAKRVDLTRALGVHGVPSFVVKLQGSQNGKTVELSRVVRFLEDDLGTVATREVSFDLVGFDGKVEVSELPVLRYQSLAPELKGSGYYDLNSGHLSIDLLASEIDTEVRACLPSELVYLGMTSHTAVLAPGSEVLFT